MANPAEASIANLRTANEARQAASGRRDAALAAQWLAAPAAGLWPENWRALATQRAADPQASWAQIGAALGWSKDKAASTWQRIRKASQ